MLREKLIDHKFGENNKFRWRSQGPIYILTAVLLTVNGTIMGRRRRRLEKQIASGSEVEPNKVSS